MYFSFPVTLNLEESDPPVAHPILSSLVEDGVEIEVELEATCDATADGIDLSHLEFSRVSFLPESDPDALKARVLMTPQLMEEIGAIAVSEVESNWFRYEDDADSYYMDLCDAAAEEQYEAYKERDWE